MRILLLFVAVIVVLYSFLLVLEIPGFFRRRILPRLYLYQVWEYREFKRYVERHGWSGFIFYNFKVRVQRFPRLQRHIYLDKVYKLIYQAGADRPDNGPGSFTDKYFFR
jgi:hypothetical protein